MSSLNKFLSLLLNQTDYIFMSTITHTNKRSETRPTGDNGQRRSYEKPRLQRVDLALEETLSAGCKLSTDSVCVGPPITAFSGGS